MATSSQWPPTTGEPISPVLVVGRLDELAYSPREYQLIQYTARHALVERNSTFYVIDLGDGHELSYYTTEDSAWRAWAVLKARDTDTDGRDQQ